MSSSSSSVMSKKAQKRFFVAVNVTAHPTGEIHVENGESMAWHRFTVSITSARSPNNTFDDGLLPVYCARVVATLHDSYPDRERTLLPPDFSFEERAYGTYEIALTFHFVDNFHRPIDFKFPLTFEPTSSHVRALLFRDVSPEIRQRYFTLPTSSVLAAGPPALSSAAAGTVSGSVSSSSLSSSSAGTSPSDSPASTALRESAAPPSRGTSESAAAARRGTASLPALPTVPPPGSRPPVKRTTNNSAAAAAPPLAPLAASRPHVVRRTGAAAAAQSSPSSRVPPSSSSSSSRNQSSSSVPPRPRDNVLDLIAGTAGSAASAPSAKRKQPPGASARDATGGNANRGSRSGSGLAGSPTSPPPASAKRQRIDDVGSSRGGAGAGAAPRGRVTSLSGAASSDNAKRPAVPRKPMTATSNAPSSGHAPAKPTSTAAAMNAQSYPSQSASASAALSTKSLSPPEDRLRSGSSRTAPSPLARTHAAPPPPAAASGNITLDQREQLLSRVQALEPMQVLDLARALYAQGILALEGGVVQFDPSANALVFDVAELPPPAFHSIAEFVSTAVPR
ncbi:NuA4 histone H4 acetyltransferase complex and the SWR1 complex subunit [Blastocladiella emersonii ATCC 22665]|nr:NuA4 histone H4 acetyltransferase complex and the SWR1 complex subunit [Blastocladiella emersonii ATCC 22665]